MPLSTIAIVGACGAGRPSVPVQSVSAPIAGCQLVGTSPIVASGASRVIVRRPNCFAFESRTITEPGSLALTPLIRLNCRPNEPFCDVNEWIAFALPLFWACTMTANICFGFAAAAARRSAWTLAPVAALEALVVVVVVVVVPRPLLADA